MNPKWQKSLHKGKSILLFDGVCNLCHGLVQFVLRHDKRRQFVFASLQSDVGKSISRHMGLEAGQLKTLVLVKGDEVWLRSSAALRVLRQLGGLWSWLYIFNVVPIPIRDAVYDWIASKRYLWFGKKDSCPMPRPEWQDRFLED